MRQSISHLDLGTPNTQRPTPNAELRARGEKLILKIASPEVARPGHHIVACMLAIAFVCRKCQAVVSG
jgi:hypothetical protein